MVDYAVIRGASVRRACALLTVGRSALRYESRMPARDEELGGVLEKMAAKNPTYGHRFAWGILTEQRGWEINIKRVRRVWRARGVTGWKREGKKNCTGKPRGLAPTGPNQGWAYDFVHDRCASGPEL